MSVLSRRGMSPTRCAEPRRPNLTWHNVPCSVLGYKIFLACSLPLVCVMFVLWVVRQLEQRRAQRVLSRWLKQPNSLSTRDRLANIVLATRRRRDVGNDRASSSDATALTVGAHTTGLGDEHCIICYAAVNALAVELLPCGHCQMCAPCVLRLWHCTGTHHPLRCPLCRQSVHLICPAHELRERCAPPCIADEPAAVSGVEPSCPAPCAARTRSGCRQRVKRALWRVWAAWRTRWSAGSCPDAAAQAAKAERLLFKDYNRKFWRMQYGDAKGRELMPWHERWVRRLHSITNAHYLPAIVAIRIALLHVSMLTYLMLPQDYMPYSFYRYGDYVWASTPASRMTGGGLQKGHTLGTAAVAVVSSITGVSVESHGKNLSALATNAWLLRLGRVVHSVLGVLMHYTLAALELFMNSVDDIFVIVVGVVIVGDLLHRLLFDNVLVVPE